MSEPPHDYDPAEALSSAEAIEMFMADALEIGNAAYVAKTKIKPSGSSVMTRAGLKIAKSNDLMIFYKSPRFLQILQSGITRSFG